MAHFVLGTFVVNITLILAS